MNEVQEMRKKIIENINKLPENKLAEIDILIKRIVLDTNTSAPKLFNAKKYFNKATVEGDILRVQQ